MSSSVEPSPSCAACCGASSRARSFAGWRRRSLRARASYRWRGSRPHRRARWRSPLCSARPGGASPSLSRPNRDMEAWERDLSFWCGRSRVGRGRLRGRSDAARVGRRPVRGRFAARGDVWSGARCRSGISRAAAEAFVLLSSRRAGAQDGSRPRGSLEAGASLKRDERLPAGRFGRGAARFGLRARRPGGRGRRVLDARRHPRRLVAGRALRPCASSSSATRSIRYADSTRRRSSPSSSYSQPRSCRCARLPSAAMTSDCGPSSRATAGTTRRTRARSKTARSTPTRARRSRAGSGSSRSSSNPTPRRSTTCVTRCSSWTSRRASSSTSATVLRPSPRAMPRTTRRARSASKPEELYLTPEELRAGLGGVGARRVPRAGPRRRADRRALRRRVRTARRADRAGAQDRAAALPLPRGRAGARGRVALAPREALPRTHPRPRHGRAPRARRRRER